VTALAAIALLALAQSETTWAAEVRLGARARSPTGNDPVVATEAPAVVAWDVELAPRVGGGVQGGGYSLLLDYTATLRARQPHLAFRAEHNHVASLQAGWRRDGRARPFLFVVGNYGVVDLTAFNTPQAAPIRGANETAPQTDPNQTGTEPQQTQQTQTPQQNTQSAPLTPPAERRSLLAYGIDGTLGVEVPLGPLVSWTTAAGFSHGGGADDSIYTMPVANSPRASTRIDVQASRLDHVATIAEARYAWFSTSAQAGDAQLSLSWRRQLTEPMSLELRAGAAGATNLEAISLSDAKPVRSYFVYPAGSINWNLRLAPRGWWAMNIFVTTGSAPYLDRFRGVAYQRVEWLAGFDIHLRDWVSWRSAGGASLSVGATRQVGNLFSGWFEGAFSVHPQDWWHADLTGAYSVVSAPGTAAPTPVSQWVIGLSLTVVGKGKI
jgi:hypothetical protein